MENSNTSNNKTILPVSYSQIAKTDIPPGISERWALIPAAQFNQERAVLCYGISSGGWQHVQPATFSECFSMQTPTLGGVAFYSGPENAVQMLAEMITAVSLVLNVGKNLRAEQIYYTANLLLNNPEYKIFTVADFRLAMNRGVMGKYGQIYDRFDINVISGWLNLYWDERQDEAERISDERHRQTKEAKPASNAVETPEWFSKFVKEFTAKTEKPEKPKFEPDALILDFWKTEWESMPEPRPKFESYCKLQSLKFQQ